MCRSAGGLAGGGDLAPTGDLDGLADVREVRAADVGGLDGPGLGPAVPFLPGSAGAGYLPPGQRPDLVVQQRLVPLHDRDVVRLLLGDQPVQVRPGGMERVAGHHRPGQVQGLQEPGEMAGLVVLDADPEVIRQAPAVLGRAEQVDPAAISAAGPAVHRDGP